MDHVTLAVFVLILTAAAAGFFRMKSLQPAALQFFPYFLLVQFGYQFFSTVYSFILTSHESNHIIFNVFMIVNIVYFSLLFHSVILSKPKRAVIVATAIANVLFYTANFVFLQGGAYLMTYSRTLMGLLIVIYCLMYFHQLVASEETDMGNPTRNATFWIVTALFFFYLCSTLTISLWNYLSFGDDQHIGPIMMRVFAFLLYGMYLAGFLLHRPIRTKSKEL